MISIPQPTDDRLRQAVDAFWEGVPPFWNHVRGHIRQVAVEQQDITVEQFHILRHIRKGHGSVSELAEVKQISRAAISQGVDTLVNKGFIRRTQDTQDRRHVQLDLTPAGNALLDAIFGDTRRWMMELLAPLTEDELQALICAAEALRRVLTP
jgi:DNA-binding MarR family transcriptional regulator